MTKKMSDDVKARLREASQRKRLREPKAKDYAVDEWLIHLDQAQDDMHARRFRQDLIDPKPGWESSWHDGAPLKGRDMKHIVGVTLKYVGDEVIEALAKRLYGVKVRYSVGPNRIRETYVLPYSVTMQLLRTLRLEDKYGSVERYASEWSARSVRTCRVIISK